MCYLKAKYIRDVRFQALWCLELLYQINVMLNAKLPEISGSKGFLPFLRLNFLH